MFYNAIPNRKHCRYKGGSVHTLYSEKRRHHWRLTQITGGTNACGCNKDNTRLSNQLSNCHWRSCWSHQRPAVEPRCWQLSLGSAGRGGLTRPYWLSHQRREGRGQCCSPLWRKSEQKKSGPPGSPHPPSMTTQRGNMMKMSWLHHVEALGAVEVGEEGVLMFVAVLALKQWRRRSLNCCL